MENKLDTLTDDQSKIEFLNDWTGKNYRKSPKEALFYAEKTIQLANATNNYSDAGQALIRIGLIHYRKADYNNALSYYSKAIDQFSQSQDSLGINQTYLNRGNIYLNRNEYTQAFKDFLSCYKYSLKYKNYQLAALSLNSLGLVKKHLKDYNKALEYYRRAAQIFKEKDLILSLYSSNTNIANILSIQNKFSEALTYYKKNLDVLKQKSSKYRLAQTYHNIGACFLEMKQYQLALQYQKQSLQLKKELGNKNSILISLNGISQAYYMLNEFEKSLQYSKRAFQLASETGNLEGQQSSSREILKTFSYLNQPDSVIYYFDTYKAVTDSLLNKENLQQIANLQTKYETEKKVAHITALEKENKTNLKQRNGLLIFLILLLAYAVFIIQSFYKNKKINKLLQIQKSRIEWHKHLLDARNQDLQISNQTKNKLFQIISHDLRSPLASVSGISKLIPLFIEQGRFKLLNETSKDLEESIRRVLNLTDNLLAWSLNQSGKLPYRPVSISLKNILMANMETYQSVAKQKNIHLQLIIDEDCAILADRHMLETVIRNLINNAIKFTAEGGIIILGAKCKEKITEIWVKDSGVGIDTDKISQLFVLNDGKSSAGTRGESGNGLGLILCRDFVHQNNGKLWVDSTVGVGSTFRFTIPNTEQVCKKEDVLTSC
ncbi:tetratricopeptide repeat-containing sensor histidine kinase [Ancylomarina longa]|uniref:tetratricopeptide repeat-containing sensor histidine kinase n=1 Tax=Ancylomarina longa TaxID=2487017 RepID=UPI001ADE8EE0|nr:tetratricopeptide repeat-containing sensor histidine kinase [Ancylomarina longa]